MRLRLVALTAVLLAAGVAPAAPAQEPQPVRVTDAGVLVDFQDADLRVVVTGLAEAGGLNVTYGDLPARRVTLRMQQPVPKADILPLLKSLAQSNGLKVTEDGGFVRLEAAGAAGPSAQARDSAGRSDETRLFVYRLKHVRAAKLASTIQTLFGGSGGGERASTPRIRPVSLSEGIRDTQGAMLLPDSTPKVTVDLGPKKAGLPGQLRGDIQIVADETTNSLLVRAQPADWEIVHQAVDALDLRPLQVLIEVVIAEVRRSNERQLSLSGTFATNNTDPQVSGTLTGVNTGDLVLQALHAGTINLSSALAIISNRGEVRIISRPVVLAQNNQEARILIGSERPFVQVSRSLPTDAASRDQVIQYRDVGTKLTITPTINDDGYVNLTVLQEVSTATSEIQFGAPVISTREASTHLFVKDGRTAVIGGLIDRQQEKTRSGIPILMDIPLLGAVFGSTHNTTSNSELFLFLTPHVIVNDDDIDRMSDSVRQEAPMLDKALREQSSKPAPSPLTGTGGTQP
jgi:general secretion pathway protein D